MMQGPNFISFAAQPHKRRRAVIACETCHMKKVKCDLESRRTEGHNVCSYCLAASRTCRLRASRRRRHRDRLDDTRGSLPVHSPPTSSDFVQSAVETTTSQASEWTLPNQMPVVTNGADAFVAGHDQQASQPTQSSLDLDIDSTQNLTSSEQPSTQLVIHRAAHTASGSSFLDAYDLEEENDALNQHLALQERKTSTTVPVSSDPSPELLQSFQETYYEHCYAFCPVLDGETLLEDLARSRLLCNALAVAGSHIKPPMIPHTGPASYYSAAKQLFYADEEPDVLLCLKALSLFYWWSPKPPTAIHRDSSWWWQSVIIRHAQQLGYHREPGDNYPRFAELNLGLRRRLWWTAFARERLTALCQGRPPIIDLDDCTVQPPSMDDFGHTNLYMKTKAEVFMNWVKLCVVLGNLAKLHIRASNTATSTLSEDYLQQLISWTKELPKSLDLNISSTFTTTFNMDVHQLHLPYLAAIVVLHLKREVGPLPSATPPAILAASCVARILKDVLARGRARSLMGITCWYTGISFLALLSARRHVGLSQAVDKDLEILELTVKQLKLMWPTANIFEQGFQRLRSSADSESALPGIARMIETDTESTGNVDWLELFPFVTTSTSELARHILADRQRIRLEQSDPTMSQPMMSYLKEFFGPGDDMDFLDMQLFT